MQTYKTANTTAYMIKANRNMTTTSSTKIITPVFRLGNKFTNACNCPSIYIDLDQANTSESRWMRNTEILFLSKCVFNLLPSATSGVDFKSNRAPRSKQWYRQKRKLILFYNATACQVME